MSITRKSGMLAGTAIEQKYVDLAEQRHLFKRVSSSVIPARSGKGFAVEKGQIFLVVQIEGPQIGDVWFFNRRDPREHCEAGDYVEF